MATYYERNKEHLLELSKQYQEKNADKIKEYQHQYYLKRKALKPPKPPAPPRPPKNSTKKPVFLSPATKFGLHKRPRYGSRKPKAVYEFTPKDDLSNGWKLKPHQLEKLLTTCPQGFYESTKVENSNPFLVKFD